MNELIFAVQDRTGTVAQLTTGSPGPENPVAVFDTGEYTGWDWEGDPKTFEFTVTAVNDSENFCISTLTATGAPGNVLASGWPKSGYVTWLSGANALSSPADDTTVVDMNVANAYCTVDYFEKYHNSRGNPFPGSPVESIMTAIVQATDYLDQRYRFKGVKLLQFLSQGNFDPFTAFIDPWLSPFFYAQSGVLGQGLYEPSTTQQHSEWPRQGVVDFNGDNVYGVPTVVQAATAEAALRVLNGTPLQPDYDPDLVSAGGVLASVTNEVGPIKTTNTYDTKIGLGFFPDIPHITRMFNKAGILVAGGGRSIIR